MAGHQNPRCPQSRAVAQKVAVWRGYLGKAPSTLPVVVNLDAGDASSGDRGPRMRGASFFLTDWPAAAVGVARDRPSKVPTTIGHAFRPIADGQDYYHHRLFPISHSTCFVFGHGLQAAALEEFLEWSAFAASATVTRDRELGDIPNSVSIRVNCCHAIFATLRKGITIGWPLVDLITVPVRRISSSASHHRA